MTPAVLPSVLQYYPPLYVRSLIIYAPLLVWITGPGKREKGCVDGGVGCVIDVNTNYGPSQNRGGTGLCSPPRSMRLSFDWLSRHLPYPIHPFILPILNSLGPFHPTPPIDLAPFVLISHPAHYPSFPTPSAAGAISSVPTTDTFHDVHIFTMYLHISLLICCVSKRNGQLQNKNEVTARGPKPPLHPHHQVPRDRRDNKQLRRNGTSSLQKLQPPDNRDQMKVSVHIEWAP